ncbi:hypothetical protein Tco_0198250, partial [Tanacetum coccineum]
MMTLCLSVGYEHVVMDLVSQLESGTSTENTKPALTSNIVSNKRVLHSTRVRLSTSASGSQLSGNTRNDRIQQTPSSNSKNKVEDHPRNVKSSLNKRNSTVQVNGSASITPRVFGH